MNYQKKYFYSFKDINEQSYTVEIWQDTPITLTPIEVVGGVNPFQIEYVGLDNKVSPVHGSGANLSMMATSTNSFVDLFTGKMQEFMVKCYKEPFDVMIWTGYIVSEMYQSEFSIRENYPVNFTATDGFGLLERMLYLTPSNILPTPDKVGNSYYEAGTKHYEGIVSQWEVITTILDKLHLPINDIRVGISTTSNDFVIGDYETIFHKTLVLNANYYNESDEAETCRIVLEGILQPYGAFIQQVNGSIYITDLNNIANNNIQPFEGFNPIDYTGMGIAYINLTLGDLSNIGFRSDKSTLDILSSINKIVVTYSNYKGVSIINFNTAEFLTGSTGSPIGNVDYQWTETICDTINPITFIDDGTWSKFNHGRFIKMDTIGIQSGTTENYLSITPYTGAMNQFNSFKYQKILPYIIPDSGYKLKIEMSAYFRTSDDYNRTNDPNKKQLVFGRIMGKLKIGDKVYKTATDQTLQTQLKLNESWGTYVDTNINNNFQIRFQDFSKTDGSNEPIYSNIGDSWVTFNTLQRKPVSSTTTANSDIVTSDYLVTLEGVTGGLLEFEINDVQVYEAAELPFGNNLYNTPWDSADLKEVRIKDIKFTVVDSNGKDLVLTDTEYISNMPPEFSEELDIKLIHGTNVTNCPIEKGSLIYWDGTKYKFCKSWNREQTEKILEALLQNTVKSNYLTPTVSLTCTVNSLPYLIGCITYENYLPDKKLVVNSAKINLEDNSTDFILTEVTKDQLDIISTYNVKY